MDSVCPFKSDDLEINDDNFMQCCVPEKMINLAPLKKMEVQVKCCANAGGDKAVIADYCTNVGGSEHK